MWTKRTDLALEARELWQESAERTTKLEGVRAVRRRSEGYSVTEVQVLNEQGARVLDKPVGVYRTVDLTGYWQRKPDFFARAVRTVGGELRSLLPENGAALVVGLGNAAMTPDAVGPEVLRHLLITRHLIASLPRQFAGFRPVAAVASGVLGSTGVESAETVRALVRQLKPEVVLAVDALAARRMNRLCCTVQLSDTGIIPGSGVGNHRAALNRRTLGVPVIAIGVPTVVDGATLAADLLEESGVTEVDQRRLRSRGRTMMVTTRDIDAQVRDLSKVIGYGINWALQQLEVEEITSILS